MKKRTLIACCILAGPIAARGAMVVRRWGAAGRVRHAGTLTYEARGEGGPVMRLDLSALPEKATIYRARLVFPVVGRHSSPFDIVPVRLDGSGESATLKPVGRPLKLVGPWHRWFDATEAARRWASEGRRVGRLWLRKVGRAWSVASGAGSAEGLRWALEPPQLPEKGVFLEIAYEGRAGRVPPQVTGVEAFYRSGQVFVTFREVEDYARRLSRARGDEPVTWADLSERFSGATMEGPTPRDEKRELRYRLYVHDKPITPETLPQARLLAVIAPGSLYDTRRGPRSDLARRKTPARRLAVRPGEPLAHGTGLYVHTVVRGGVRHYAVVAAADGVENTTDVGEANTAGPVRQRRAEPRPVLQADRTTDLRGGRGTYHEQWYSLWADAPLAPRPLRYDVAVGFCPQAMARPTPLTITRGHFTNPGPEMPGPARRRGLVMAHSAEQPYHGVWTGVSDAEYNLKGVAEGSWQPFCQRRQELLVRWMQERWEVDPARISLCTGSWGMWELRRGDLYAYMHGWGMPEISKGFQCWHWANGVWGPHVVYARKPDAENPFRLHDYTRYVREHPEKELPFLALHTGWGDHFTEMGWPPFPRFVRALIDTKRAFVMHSRCLGDAMRAGLIRFRHDASVPAFGNCSLDDNLGEGDLRSGKAFGQINGHLTWHSRTIVDEPGAYAVTVQLWATAPLPSCTVDLTPRRCRRFKPEHGREFTWTNTTVSDGRRVGSGTAAADEHGLVTVKGLRITKDRHRITIRRKE